MIKHTPLFDTKKVCEVYSEKDGVDVRYVCTSALGDENFARDIFYRDEPHPEFGNRYFALFWGRGSMMISSADQIEDVEFCMVAGKFGWEYSQHRHHYYNIEGTGCAIDGGRAYARLVGDMANLTTQVFVLRNGLFVPKDD